MQEGIIQIGRALMEGKNLLDNLVTQVPLEKKKRKQHVLKFDFATDHVELRLDGMKEIDEKTAEEYLYIGGAAGANAPQWYCTASNSFYLLSETVPNLLTHNLGEELNQKIRYIFEQYYVEIDPALKSNKNRYALNIGKLLNTDFHIQDYYTTIQNEPEKTKKDKLKKEILAQFERYLKENLELSYQDIGLFTILVDGEKLCGREEYQSAIMEEKQTTKAGAKPKVAKGVCAVCNSTEGLRSDINVEIKTYTTNLHGFAHNADKKEYAHNMQLCPDCLAAYLAGEKYIKNNLSFSMARFRVYAYPHFIFGESLNRTKLRKFAGFVTSSFQTVTVIDDLEKLNDYLKDYQERTEDISLEVDTCSLDIVFYKTVQKGTKIQAFMKDIAPARLRQIAAAQAAVSHVFNPLVRKDQSKVGMNLKMIYYLVPMREKDGDVTQYRSFLQLYTAILSQGKIEKEYVIKNLNKCAKVMYFQETGYNISLPDSASAREQDQAFVRKMLQGDMLLWFLREIGNIDGGIAMDTENLQVEPELKEYIEKMQYGEMETSLFLLGILMGRIGTAQYKRNPEKKPILNKLNFGGMDKGKLIRLGNSIFQKLSQEKLLGSNEKIYGVAMGLLDEHFSEWKLSKNENLHYLLSGFSYATMKAMSSKKEQGGNEDEQQ